MRETFPLPLAPLPDTGVTGDAGAVVAAVGSLGIVLTLWVVPILSEIVDELIKSESLKMKEKLIESSPNWFPSQYFKEL